MTARPRRAWWATPGGWLNLALGTGAIVAVFLGTLWLGSGVFGGP